MKTFLVMLILPAAVFLTGCSALEEVSDSLSYVNEAADYIDEVNQFADELPAAAEAAVTDVNAKIQLEELLAGMQSEIEGFDQLEAPAMLEDIHNQAIEHNQELANGIELYLESIDAGTISSEYLSEIGLLEDIAVYDDLLNEMKKLQE
ncbi:DUF6376 family protein [Pradoshia sp.]